MNQFEQPCPVCGQSAEKGVSSQGDAKQFDCPKCGQYQLSGSASATIKGRLNEAGPTVMARVSHGLRQLQRYKEWPLIGTSELNTLINTNLPNPDAQLANLIRWMMDEVKDGFLSPIEEPDNETLASIIGAKDGDHAAKIVNHAVDDGLIEWVPDTCIALTVKGSRSMKQLMTDELTLVSSSGEIVKSGVKGRITSDTLVTFDTTLPIRPADRFLRQLPSGMQEEFIVEDPGYQAGLPGLEAHYQCKVRRSDVPAQKMQTIVNNIKGANARVNINSTDNSSNFANHDNRIQIYNDLRQRAKEISADKNTIEAILKSIDEMENAHGEASFIQKYQNFMSLAADHLSVFGPLIGALAGVLPS